MMYIKRIGEMTDVPVAELEPSHTDLAAAAVTSTVRHLEPADIGQICDLFIKTFRKGLPVRRDDVAACLEQTYLTSPKDRIKPASLVDIGADGRIQGFMGIITLGLRMSGQSLRGGMAGNFMASDVDRGARARSALRLLRATVSQDLDCIFTDTANRTTLDVTRAFKFNVLPLQSLEWVKVLRPCETAGVMLAKRLPMLARPLAVMGRVSDVVGRRLPFALQTAGQTGCIVDRPVEPAVFAARAPDLITRFRLRPEWNEDELAWLLDQSSRKTRNGPLHIREVTDGEGRTLGFYVLYGRSGAVAQVLQILPQRTRETVVLGALIRYAGELGAVAVRGMASPVIADGLMRQGGIFYHHVAATLVHAKDPDLQDAFRSQNAFMGGLLGEGWTRLVADEFI